jgi:hypothetical protein
MTDTKQKSPVSLSAGVVEPTRDGSQPAAGRGAGEPGTNTDQPHRTEGWDCDEGWELATPEALSEVFTVKPVNVQ